MNGVRTPRASRTGMKERKQTRLFKPADCLLRAGALAQDISVFCAIALEQQ